MKYKIVLVRFPFVENDQSKYRPALCLTDEIGVYKTIIVAFITSNPLNDPLPTDVTINESDEDFLETGLKVNSAIKINRLTTITKNKIVGEFGLLPESYRKKVLESIKKVFK